MIHRTTAAMMLAMLAYPSLALAQDRGSEKDQEACTPDVFRLCQDFIPDEGAIVACLQAKRVQLSPACAPVIFPSASTGDTTATIRKRASGAPARKKRPAVKAAC